jgi:Zn-dependent peptidase ImmA (M78 family)/transcriptional regulator with XRE-family HTH domain
MIAERLRGARLIAGLSQEELAFQLSAAGQPITKAAISKYETGKSVPTAPFIFKLAQILKVKPTYFLTEPMVEVNWLAFRRHSDLPVATQEQIKSYATHVAEQQIEVQTLLYPSEPPIFPSPRRVTTFEEAELAAESLRQTWQIANQPVDNLFQRVEDHGGVVVQWIEDSEHFDGLSGWGNGVKPIIVINNDRRADRKRFNLAHELGHLLMDTSGLTEPEQEKLAQRFAAAFLVPADTARHELGNQRHTLDWQELGVLKQKYGMSIAAWIYRAKELRIISDTYCKALRREINLNGWRFSEPFEYIGQEEPARLKQMTLRAVAEGIISEDRGRELCPECFVSMPLPSIFPSARNLLKLPADERDSFVRMALERTASDDIELFEAFGEDDFDDQYSEI